jgi:two-component system CheB/CheR fusion protein
MVRGKAPSESLRVWVAGCSTGEETYSFAMLIREAMTEAKLNIKLQIFASDIDSEAIARAREGLYPDTIEAEVSAERLTRFFSREDRGYRVLPELRAAVVFTVQDVLADPPFSRIDLVSCRNLLIYLRPEAQAKVVALFHFALRDGGLLVLGTSETIGTGDGRFEVISKTNRLYRHIGRSRPGELGFAMNSGGGPRVMSHAGPPPQPTQQTALADLCRRIVLENYAPAAVLINRAHECLYSMGPTDRYLRVAPGQATHDLLAMARPDIRNKLRAAIQQATRDDKRAVVTAGSGSRDAAGAPFNIVVRPIRHDGEPLLLICFVDVPGADGRASAAVAPPDLPRVAALELELEATKQELEAAIRNLEISGDEQKAINEEALSVAEEYQSTNEELLTSKEELQSLNEELTALNSQLQETLDRQRTTANDLQNVLYSTDIATLFLDANLDIRFYTPATRSLFSVIPSDIGRPLADLNALVTDTDLLSDAQKILGSSVPIEREIRSREGAWYLRRVLPYRTHENGVEGVVITFTNITERKLAASAMENSRHEAEAASLAKSRFLAAASHDLRQPLQTLSLLQGLLSRKVEGDAARKLVALMAPTLDAMSGMLNMLLDINQIDSGTVHSEPVNFPIDEMLRRLRDEFDYHAKARTLDLRVVACGLVVRTDPGLLEQMVRNLLSNALKYTRHGKVLLGCRRRADVVSIEVWDIGIGIPASELTAIFGEYHQIGNHARERSRGLGLGLYIVQRLSTLLDLKVRVRSVVGKGSMFAIDVARAPAGIEPPGAAPAPVKTRPPDAVARRTGRVLVIEDDPEILALLEFVLTEDGHHVIAVAGSVAARDMVARRKMRPDLILADFNLPGEIDGLRLAATLRRKLNQRVPVIIHDCVQLNKPVTPLQLTETIQLLLPAQPAPADHRVPPAAQAIGAEAAPVIFVVDDDPRIRESIRRVLEAAGRVVEDFSTGEDFLDAHVERGDSCLLVDASLPGMNGIDLLTRLRAAGHTLPAIMITGASDVGVAVRAMKAGASDFLEKQFSHDDLLASIDRALDQARDSTKLAAWRDDAAARLAGLTGRQREIMARVLAGEPSKNIAADLGISQRTVENHRAAIMRKTGCASLPALARLALAAVPPPARDVPFIPGAIEPGATEPGAAT